MSNKDRQLTRRNVIQAMGVAGLGAALPAQIRAATAQPSCGEILCRPIPSTGEVIPAAGVGTNRFGAAGVDTAKDVLKEMYELGGRVIDTAALYGDSEAVIGTALEQLGLRDQMFVATKFNAPGAQFRGGIASPKPGEVNASDSFARSLDRLRTDHVDLLFAHFVSSVEPTMELMLELKEKGLARHIGITSVQRSQHAKVMEYMRKYPIDFLQIDYSLGNRETAIDVLPLAIERKIAVMVAVPFGGRRNSLFASVGETQVPEWGAEFGATSWGQFFLKYVLAHPAVTCVIPGTTNVKHMRDNQIAALNNLPDESTVQRMEAYWDSIS